MDEEAPSPTTEFEAGFVVGLLVGEGHFGGDGRRPQITLRMHTRHVHLFEWLVARFPRGRLYGPYHHGGRDYYQWMARGAFLRDEMVPLLDRHLRPGLDGWAYQRYSNMKTRYGLWQEPDGEMPAPPLASEQGDAPGDSTGEAVGTTPDLSE
jgi:hypothetical protein